MSVRAAQIGKLKVKARWNGKQQPVPCGVEAEDLYLVFRSYHLQRASADKSRRPRERSNSIITVLTPKPPSSTPDSDADVPSTKTASKNTTDNVTGLLGILGVIEKLHVRAEDCSVC